MIELSQRDDHALTLRFGGDTLNCSVYLARLVAGRGVRVDYVTALGDDPYSDAMLAAWHAEGISTEYVARLPGRLPGLYLIRTDAHGERTFYNYRSEAPARQMLADGRAARLTAALAGYDLLFVTGVTLSILDDAQRAQLVDLLAAARRQGAGIVFDGNFRPRAWRDAAAARRWFDAVLAHATIALPTFEDEQGLYGDADPAATVARLQAHGVAEVAVKLGAQGALVAAAGRAQRVAATPVAAVDTTGAGDSFNGAYLACRLLGQDPVTAAAAANRVAAVKVRHRGAIIPASAMPDLGL
jgi:2-dehydro-3-deoxygluconokinase